jgi:hypothetical protein
MRFSQNFRFVPNLTETPFSGNVRAFAEYVYGVPTTCD